MRYCEGVTHHHTMAIHTVRSYAEIAASLDLWRDRMDTDLALSDEEFQAMSIDERVALMVEVFGPEPTDEELSDDLGFDA
jgi:hypothetical protein